MSEEAGLLRRPCLLAKTSQSALPLRPRLLLKTSQTGLLHRSASRKDESIQSSVFLSSAVYIFVSDNIIFTQVLTALHFNHHQS